MSSSNKPAANAASAAAAIPARAPKKALEQEFNSRDAQRSPPRPTSKPSPGRLAMSCPTRYDDSGFTKQQHQTAGAPALLASIEIAWRSDCVLVNESISCRGHHDFARLMETFDSAGSPSSRSPANSSTSSGRLVLNVLLSFRQFELEIILERTTTAIAAARRKGKWSGGHPILGHDVDERSKLIVSEAEAKRVRAIFALYLKHPGLISVVQSWHGAAAQRAIARSSPLHPVGVP